MSASPPPSLNLVKRSRLIPPQADPYFFATDVAALAAIEREASEKIYNVLLAAKNKHLKSLHTAAMALVFTEYAHWHSGNRPM